MVTQAQTMGQAPSPDPQGLSREERRWHEGRLREELARKKRCCENCVYATRPGGKWLRLVLARFAGLLLCANAAEAPGELRGVPGSSTCANFRLKRLPTVRTAPPPPPADKAFYYIPLTQGQYALVDAEDYERVSRHKWCLSRAGGRLYAQRRYRGKTQRMHQFLMDPPPGKVVDHKDGNGLNNRRCNLRICDQHQNLWNQRKSKRGVSPYVGVYRYAHRPDKWFVRIECNGDKTHRGSFDSEIDAARARDHLAVQRFGEFAHLNLPDEWPPERRAAVIAEAASRAAQSVKTDGTDREMGTFYFFACYRLVGEDGKTENQNVPFSYPSRGWRLPSCRGKTHNTMTLPQGK